MTEVKISRGNSKLGKIPNINLPPVVTCEKGVPCANKECYALKAFKQYKNVRDAWGHNLKVYLENSTHYFESIINQLKKIKNVFRFRWHSSGDIVD